MENVKTKRSNLVMPTHYQELTREEMEYVDGGGLFSKIWDTVCAAVGGCATIVAGVGGVLAPDPTGLTKVIGVATIVGGVTILGTIVTIWA